MRLKIILILLAIFCIAIYPAITSNPNKDKPQIIEITKNSTQFYLDSLTGTLARKGIVLKLDTVGFNESGELQIISGKIYFSSTCNGTFATDNLDKISISKNRRNLSIKVN